jgi:FkbM family methyltransferase
MNRCEFENVILDGKTIEELRNWENNIFSEMLSQTNGRIVLFGAGAMGRKLLEVLRQERIEPIAFSDNDSFKWGKTIDGLIVLSPEEAAKTYGDNSLFIITVARTLVCDYKIMEQLKVMSCVHILFWTNVIWKYGFDRFIEIIPKGWRIKPSEIAGDIDIILEAYNLLHDSESKEVFLNLLKSRVCSENGWKFTISKQKQYFNDIINVNCLEAFIDCGAYDGDTVRDFLSFTENQFHSYYAFEPMDNLFSKLTLTISKLDKELRDKIKVFKLATGDKKQNLMFKFSGPASGVSEEGEISVNSVKVDDLLEGKLISWIKMDIEGAELAALEGAKNIISLNRPKLTICVYHKTRDLWEILIWIHKHCVDYNILLRMHEGYDVVCYAMPAK